jgi:hypothetical protein
LSPSRRGVVVICLRWKSCSEKSAPPGQLRTYPGLRFTCCAGLATGQMPHRPPQARAALVTLFLDAVTADRPDPRGDADADGRRSTAASPFLLNPPPDRISSPCRAGGRRFCRGCSRSSAAPSVPGWRSQPGPLNGKKQVGQRQEDGGEAARRVIEFLVRLRLLRLPAGKEILARNQFESGQAATVGGAWNQGLKSGLPSPGRDGYSN